MEGARMNIFSSWMTTIPGILTLVTVLFQIWQTKTIDWAELQRALLAVGLIAAKDFNVTGGTR
jgi:hypothetical protein